MPPPPCEWQPEQFIQAKSRWPWAMCQALPSKAVPRSAACIALLRGSRVSRAHAARSRRAAMLAREREDIEPPSRVGTRRQVADGVDEAERRGRIAAVERAGNHGA